VWSIYRVAAVILGRSFLFVETASMGTPIRNKNSTEKGSIQRRRQFGFLERGVILGGRSVALNQTV
jgi:hypothetical protein